MAAVLDADLPGRTHGDPTGHLRGGRGGWRHRHKALRVCDLSHAGEPVPGLYAALHVVDHRRLHHAVFRIERCARFADGSAGDLRLPRGIRPWLPRGRRGRRDVGPAGADPHRIAPDPAAAGDRGAVMSLALTAARPRHRYRLRRNFGRAATAVLGVVIAFWTLIPVYNMLLIALSEDGDEFTGTIWPSAPNLESFWAIWLESNRYLEGFWHQFGNSIYLGLTTMVLTVLVGSLASFAM